MLEVAYTYLSVVYDGVLPPTEVLQLLRTGYDREARAKLTADENEQFGVAVHYVSTATAAWCFSRGYAEYDRKFTEAGAQEAGASEPVHYQRTGPS